jgi:hypothetical protein
VPGPRFESGAIGMQWSDMDDSDQLNFDARGVSIEQTADFLCKRGREVMARLEALKPKAK